MARFGKGSHFKCKNKQRTQIEQDPLPNQKYLLEKNALMKIFQSMNKRLIKEANLKLIINFYPKKDTKNADLFH